MNWLRTHLRAWWRRITTLEPLPDDHKQPGDGLARDDHERRGEGPVDDLLRNLPPSAGGSGI
jgi:hypothetical protein